MTSAPSHAAGVRLAVPAHEERAPTSFYVTACTHEADLPKGRNRVRRTRVVIVKPQDNKIADVRAGLNLIVNKP